MYVIDLQLQIILHCLKPAKLWIHSCEAMPQYYTESYLHLGYLNVVKSNFFLLVMTSDSAIIISFPCHGRCFWEETSVIAGVATLPLSNVIPWKKQKRQEIRLSSLFGSSCPFSELQQMHSWLSHEIPCTCTWSLRQHPCSCLSSVIGLTHGNKAPDKTASLYLLSPQEP